MKTLAQIQQTLRHYQSELKNKYGIERLAIFGSYARQEQTEESDIDILVELGQQPLGMRYLDFAAELETILQHKVDIVSRRGIKPQYFQAIEKDLKYV
ncbi:MAG: nucleotidyltransferase family protein [Thiotrichaceae bacterium]|nr:nucleotidyltransferase family protein [Thiotrichaceae bacterium]